MKNKFIISENDRRSILSMYGVLNEDNTTRIIGKVLVEYTFGYSSTLKNNLQNIKVDLYGDNILDDGEVLGGDGISEIKIIGTTTTNSEGEYFFEGVSDLSNLLLRVNGNEFFKPKDVRIPTIKANQDNVFNINLEYKDSSPSGPADTKSIESTINKCEKKDSNQTNVFGYGEESKYVEATVLGNYKSEEDKLIKNSIGTAIKDAMNDYLMLFPNDEVNLDEMVGLLNSNQTDNTNIPKVRVICKKTYTDKGMLIATSVVKYKKADLDKMVLFMLKPKEEPPRKLNFDDYDFQKALEVSWDLKKKIFLFICNDTDEECNTLLTDFVLYGNLDQKLNGYVRLYYNVDRSQTNKYVLAAQSMGINTYPTVVILQAINDPKTNTTKDSIKIIKKITRFERTPSGMSSLVD
jgi:hypothetical protein